MAPPNTPAHLAKKIVKRRKKFVRHQSDRKIAVKVRLPLRWATVSLNSLSATYTADVNHNAASRAHKAALNVV